jgi:photosystem II stability/assembly factor-like uncharacterized protein
VIVPPKFATRLSHVARAALVAGAALVVLPRTASANGRYPAASQLLVDPNDPKHIVVSATFGLLESRDAGKSFGWLCEAAIGTEGQQDLMLALAGNGATVVAMYNGITTTQDGCAFRAAPELAGRTMGDLAGSKSAPHELIAFWNEFKTGGMFDAQIVRSIDDGQSWAKVGGPLDPVLYPLTIDITPSLPTRVYLSARGDKTKNFGSMLMRSDDGGATFASVDVPGTEEHRLVYIAAVHPFDPDRVYLRVYDLGAGTVILATKDGGKTFETLLTGTDQLLGFAISPDGTQIAIGGPMDGLWIGAADGTNLARRSDVGATCLTWTKDALYACADYQTAGFSIGRSIDSGATFEPLYRYDRLCGRATCGKDNTARCTMEWELIAPAIGATCDRDAGGSEPGTGDAGRDASAPGDAPGGSGGGTGAGAPKEDSSCTIGGPIRSHRGSGIVILLIGLAASCGRALRLRARRVPLVTVESVASAGSTRAK